MHSEFVALACVARAHFSVGALLRATCASIVQTDVWLWPCALSHRLIAPLARSAAKLHKSRCNRLAAQQRMFSCPKYRPTETRSLRSERNLAQGKPNHRELLVKPSPNPEHVVKPTKNSSKETWPKTARVHSRPCASKSKRSNWARVSSNPSGARLQSGRRYDPLAKPSVVTSVSGHRPSYHGRAAWSLPIGTAEVKRRSVSSRGLRGLMRPATDCEAEPQRSCCEEHA